jgi:inner membrane protein
MDNLTHTALATFLSRVGPGRWTPYGTAVILLGANIPDIDVVAALGGGLNYLHFHRHITHSLAAMPFMALAAAGIVRLIARRPMSWPGAWFAALLGVASHLLLDSTNAYAVRLLLPFSSAWQSLDINYVADLWILAACLLGLAAPVLGHLVGSEIASSTSRARHYGRGWAWFVLGFVLLYEGARFMLHSRAVTAAGSQLYQDAVPLRTAALPGPVNPMRWRGLVETADSVAVQDINLAGDPGSARPLVFHKPEPDPAIEAARRTPTFQTFLGFSQWPLWRVTPSPEHENARLVEVFDMRFGTPIDPGFMVSAVVDAHGQVIENNFRFGRIGPR